MAVVAVIAEATPEPIPIGSASAANQSTLIAVAIIGAIASITTASITAFFAYLMVKVKRTTESTHRIINHDRQVNLEAQAEILRLASHDHPDDALLAQAWLRAVKAAEGARRANELGGPI